MELPFSKYRLHTVTAGHEVVRLPVAHCELNPIEMAWSPMKSILVVLVPVLVATENL